MPLISICWTQSSLIPNLRKKSKMQEFKLLFWCSELDWIMEKLVTDIFTQIVTFLFQLSVWQRVNKIIKWNRFKNWLKNWLCTFFYFATQIYFSGFIQKPFNTEDILLLDNSIECKYIFSHLVCCSSQHLKF